MVIKLSWLVRGHPRPSLSLSIYDKYSDDDRSILGDGFSAGLGDSIHMLGHCGGIAYHLQKLVLKSKKVRVTSMDGCQYRESSWHLINVLGPSSVADSKSRYFFYHLTRLVSPCDNRRYEEEVEAKCMSFVFSLKVGRPELSLPNIHSCWSICFQSLNIKMRILWWYSLEVWMPCPREYTTLVYYWNRHEHSWILGTNKMVKKSLSRKIRFVIFRPSVLLCAKRGKKYVWLRCCAVPRMKKLNHVNKN